MLLANLQNVTKRFGAQTVLHEASFQISSGQKLGLVGPNGAGKTTILRILTGREAPDSGNAVLAGGVRVGYVPQHADYDDEAQVMDCILEEHRAAAAQLRAAEQRLADSDEAEMKRSMRAYQRARDHYDDIGGDLYGRRAEAMLDALGLAGRAEQKVGSLSGGEKNVLSLAQALLSDPDLLLLDEPANHLDYIGIAWLEDFLVKLKGAVLIVSHNRYLLDRVVGGILHLQDGRIDYCEGNYSTYRAENLRRLIARQEDYIANQKRLAQIEALVRRLADRARRADPAVGRQLRARRKQLEREKADAVEKPTLVQEAIRPRFAAEATRANIALQVRGYGKAFGKLVLFDAAEMDIACGERIALVGANGSGKTTLLRDVVEHGAWENPTIRIGPSLSVGYCAQQQEVLDHDGTVLDEIMACGRIGRRDAHGILARFLFGQGDLNKRVRSLSGGERNRLQLARLMVLKPNFLILDEPTNHLDILGREAIEEALADFAGTILVVSHDRYFLDKVATRVVEVRDRRLESYPGGFTDFWYARRGAVGRVAGRVASRGRARRRTGGGTGARSVEELELRIRQVEQEKVLLEQRIEEAFARRDRQTARRASKQLDQMKLRIQSLYDEWAEAAE